MKKNLVYLIVVLVALIISGRIALSQVVPQQSHQSTTDSQPSIYLASSMTPQPSVTSNPMPSKNDGPLPNDRQVGHPAITLSKSGIETGTLTKSDVIQYHNAMHKHGVDRFLSSTEPTILDIEFLTVRELKSRAPMAVPFGMSDDDVICYVRYKGSFTINDHPNTVYNFAEETFDIHTGNQLSVGLGPWIK